MSNLARFKGSAKLRTLHPAEKALLGIAALHLCFLPWALGAMHVQAQCISLGLSVLSFGLALISRTYSEEYTGGASAFRMAMWPKLLKFPIFWIGLTFLLYILIQALNPAYRYMPMSKTWWLLPLPHISWLPQGMDTPFAKASPWRSLVVYGSAWATTCALWVGFTRRKTLRIFFTLLAVNAFILALLGIAERALHADKILWSWHTPATYFVATFIYKNHAGAYFDLLLSLCVSLAALYHTRSRQRLKKSSPSGLFAFFAVILALIVIFSYSRAALILMFGYLGFALLVFFVEQLRSPSRSGGSRAGVAILCVLLGGSVLFGLYYLPTATALERMDTLIKTEHATGLNGRRLATQATLDLFQASPVYGWGAGSFRFAFPQYQRRYPGLMASDGIRLYWEHAHNDYAELLAEVGIVGVGILGLGGAYYLIALLRRRFWKNSFALLLFSGCAVTLVHSLGDFNFYNPAILITWCAFWPAMIRLIELEPATDEGSRSVTSAAK